MSPGDHIVMIRFPKEKYAMDYCKDNGLYVGCICKYNEKFSNSSMLETHVEFSVGSLFLSEYFKKSFRFENLEKLLGSDIYSL